jgi:hypothetical protein
LVEKKLNKYIMNVAVNIIIIIIRSSSSSRAAALQKKFNDWHRSASTALH